MSVSVIGSGHPAYIIELVNKLGTSLIVSCRVSSPGRTQVRAGLASRPWQVERSQSDGLILDVGFARKSNSSPGAWIRSKSGDRLADVVGRPGFFRGGVHGTVKREPAAPDLSGCRPKSGEASPPFFFPGLKSVDLSYSLRFRLVALLLRRACSAP